MAAQGAEVLSSSPGTASKLLAENHMKNAAAGGAGGRYVRRTHSGKLGRVKKDGAGGKGTWGKLLDTEADPCLDRNDPNYDSGEEPYQLVGVPVSTESTPISFEGKLSPIDDYKNIVTIIEEYFSNGDVELAATELKDLGADEYHHYFVKKLVSMASVLLSALYSDVVSSAQIGQGFVLLLESAVDLALDILDAVDIIALFNAPESSKGLQAIQTAEKSYLSAPHHAELVERHWGGSTHITVEEVKKKITYLLREYVENGDIVQRPVRVSGN